VTCKNHEIVWNHGDPGDYFVVIIRGTIAVYRSNEDGDENMLGVFGPGDVIGLSAVLGGRDFPATARSCAVGTEILKIFSSGVRLPAIDDGLAHDQHLLDNWLRDLVLAHEKILQDKIEITAAGNVGDRIYQLLKSLLYRFGSENNGEENFIPLALSKTLIGKGLGF
jgi:CRP-like cAMP-binding protein